VAAEASVAECLRLEGQSTDGEEDARYDEYAEDGDERVPFEQQSDAGRRSQAAAGAVVFVRGWGGGVCDERRCVDVIQ